MAQVFKVLPLSLFRPLTGQGAPIYAQILLQLLEETQRHAEPLSRELALNLVLDQLSADALELTQDALEADALEATDDRQTRAAAILRYLARCGWLRGETQNDFTQSFVLPDYAFRLLRVLGEIAANDPPPLQGLIFAIHDLLQASVRDGNADIRLPEAHRQTLHLLNALKELQHNIGAQMERVLQQMHAQAVLDQFFGSYHDEIVNRAYHQLRTTDHVSRYRPGVIEATAQLARETTLRETAQHLVARGGAAPMDDAMQELESQTRVIRDNFLALDSLLEAIDVRHSRFVDAAVRTIEQHLLAQTTTSGQLGAILSALLNPSTDDVSFQNITVPLVNLYEFELLDSQSLAAPARTPTPFVVEAETVIELSPEEIAASYTATLAQMQRVISRERVRNYVGELLRHRSELRGADIPLTQPDELALLIYLRAYGDGTLGYQVQPDENAEWVQHGEIGFRDFVIKQIDRK